METQNKAQRAKKIQAIIRAEDSDFAEMLLEYAEIMQAHDWRGRVDISAIARKAGALSERLRRYAWIFISYLSGEGTRA